MKIIIINGPNLNLLGKREPGIYGNLDFETFLSQLKAGFPGVDLDYYQSNLEGKIVDKLQEVGYSYDGIVLNAAAYTHTSIAIADAIAAIDTPVLEIHISNIHGREAFRQKSMISGNCIGMIAGLGLKGYQLALHYFTDSPHD